jgi:hypothetical protein
VRAHASDGGWALRIDLQPGEYPGVSLEHPLPDWSRYDVLRLDLVLDDGPPLVVVVKIEDRHHTGDYHDRFHQSTRLMPGENDVRVLLSEVARAPRDRPMDLTRIARVQLFTGRLDARRTLYLDNVRLQ